jgi:hypothetical protein
MVSVSVLRLRKRRGTRSESREMILDDDTDEEVSCSEGECREARCEEDGVEATGAEWSCCLRCVERDERDERHLAGDGERSGRHAEHGKSGTPAADQSNAEATFGRLARSSQRCATSASICTTTRLPMPIGACSSPRHAREPPLCILQQLHRQQHTQNIPKAQPVAMASARATSDTPLPTTETADLPASSSAPSIVTDEQWKAMAALLTTMYAHRTDE